MIVVTGAAGFIGSNIVNDLLNTTDEKICVCDRELEAVTLNRYYKERGKDLAIEPEYLFSFMLTHKDSISAVVHMGATTSTTEKDIVTLLSNNVRYTVNLWFWCAINKIRLIYASSASVYGNDSSFWDSDNPADMKNFYPLNPYGQSKLATDRAIWTLQETEVLKPPQCVGLRFFNVYGPGESHKGDQASIITKSIGKNIIDLFDVKASRDFVYVKDCSRYVLEFLKREDLNGCFNIGSETSRPFEDIAQIMGMGINYIPMPEALNSQYQFTTKASMNKAKFHQLWFPPTTLEDGIKDYLSNL